MKRSLLPSSIKEFIDGLDKPRSSLELCDWGARTAAGLTNATDRIVLPLISSLNASSVSVYALGGYGRRELAPFSDVDLLIVTYEAADLSETMAALWDTGLNPSIIIRESGRLKESVADDLLFATSILDARWLFGAKNSEIDNASRWLSGISVNIVEKLKKECESRHRKHDGAGYQEPNLRDGRGGLRDLQTKRWLLAALDGNSDAGDFTGEDQENLNILLAARTIVHIVLSKREDRIPLSERDSIFEWLGWPEHDSFVRWVFVTMKKVAASFSFNPDHDLFAPDLSDPRKAATEFREFLDSFSEPIGSERGSCGKYVRELERAGILEKILPEWRNIDCLPRSDAAHLYTPEEHTLRVIEKVEVFFREPPDILDFSSLSRRDVVLLTALFHDIGKGSGKNHADEGSRIASDTMLRWGYAEADAELVSWLVRHHQTLSHHAFRRDIDDPALIHSLAKTIGHVQRLKMLYVITRADLESVSHELYSDWKASLLDKLAIRLERQCRATLPPVAMAAAILDRRRRVVGELLSGQEYEVALDEHFTKIDARYALAHTPQQIALHIQLIPRLQSAETVIEKRLYPRHGFVEITVVTKSRTGIFAEIAGTLSARDFNILEADVFTRNDGIAIDTFKVDDRAGLSGDEARWQAVAADIRGVLAGQSTAEAILQERIPYAKTFKPADENEPSVTFDNESSDTHTIIEIVAPDRMGLLYDIAAFFRDCKVGITSAIVSTASDLAVDVFYVTAGLDEKITEKTAVAAVRQGLLGRLTSNAEKTAT